MSEKHAGGRPPKYTNADDMQVLIDQYFAECEGKPYIDPESGEAVLDKLGRPVIVGAKPPTITGLALALGFNSRVSLLNYQDKDEFMNTLSRAKSRVEAFAEGSLYSPGVANGAKFSLANNFKSWSERQEIINHNLNSDLDDLDDDQRKAEIDRLLSLIKE